MGPTLASARLDVLLRARTRPRIGRPAFPHRCPQPRPSLGDTAQLSERPIGHTLRKGQVMTASTTPPVSLPEKIRHYIGGEFVDSIDGEEFDVLNPVTNEAYIKASSGKKADIEAAVAAA